MISLAMAAWHWKPKKMSIPDMRAVLNYMNVIIPHHQPYPHLAELEANYPIMSKIENTGSTPASEPRGRWWEETEAFTMTAREEEETKVWQWKPGKGMTSGRCST